MKNLKLAVGTMLVVILGCWLMADNPPAPPQSIPPATGSTGVSRLEEITPTSSGSIPPQIKQILSQPANRVRLSGETDIRTFLRAIMEIYQLNIVATKEVAGKMSIFLGKLENITVGELLEIALITNDLAMEIKGDTIVVMTAGQFTTLYGRAYNDNKQFKVIKLKYLKPSQVKDLLSSTLALTGSAGEVINHNDASGVLVILSYPQKLKRAEEFLKNLDVPLENKVFELQYAQVANVESMVLKTKSEIGEVKTDVRTRKIFVTDTVDSINKISKLIAALDVKNRQVLIEARMIQIQLNEQNYLGVNWDKVFSSQSQWNGLRLTGKYPFPPALQSQPSATFVATVGNMPADNFTATVAALQTYGSLRAVSSPRIIAFNDTLGKIMVGTRQAYATTNVTTTQGGQTVAENVQFIDVGITLAVTPTINADEFITMHIAPEISSVLDRIQTSQGNVIPIVETTNINLDVMVKNGVTIVIGGLIKDEKRKSRNGIPIIKDLPLVGPIFSQTGEVNTKTETVIFLTPYIVSGDADESWLTKQREMQHKEPMPTREIK